jgi:hypothetical protein
MNKLEIMKQPSVEFLLREMIRFKPGITTQKLWEVTKEWHGSVVHPGIGMDFDIALGNLRSEFRCTNKQWYPAGHQAPPQSHGPRKEDPRQVRMDW